MPDLPFLTRKHLDFDQTATFSLVLTEQSVNTGDILITGATKAGPFSYRYSLANSTTPTVKRFNLPDVPLFVSVSAADVYMNPGTVYLSLSLEINSTLCQVLLSGYLYSMRPMTWPQADVQSSVPVLVTNVSQQGANPAAGAEVSDAVPLYEVWAIKGIRLQLVTSSTVANRRVHIGFRFGGAGRDLEFSSNTDQAASLTRNYTCAPVDGAGVFTDDNDILIPIPGNILLNYADSIFTSTTNIQAGDNWGAPTYIYERYLVNANT